MHEAVADAFNRLYYFERAAETYIRALQTGRKQRILSHEIAEKTAAELDRHPGQADRYLAQLRNILEDEGVNHAN